MTARVKATFGIFFFFLAIHLPFSFPASAGAPTDMIRSSVDKILAVLKNERLRSKVNTKERRDQLRRAILARFDFAEMAKRSLGSHWRRRTPEEQREFVRLFTDLMERAYINRIEAYTNEKFVYLRENVDKDYAEVAGRIVTSRGEEFSIDYRVHLVDGEWKVYDVVVENVSLVNNYRSQFNRILANASYEELVRRMKDKQIEMAGDKKK